MTPRRGWRWRSAWQRECRWPLLLCVAAVAISAAHFLALASLAPPLLRTDDSRICPDGWSTRAGLAPFLELAARHSSGGSTPILADAFESAGAAVLHAVLITSHMSHTLLRMPAEAVANWTCLFRCTRVPDGRVVDIAVRASSSSSRAVDPQAHTHVVACAVPHPPAAARPSVFSLFSGKRQPPKWQLEYTVKLRWEAGAGGGGGGSSAVELGPVPFCKMPRTPPSARVGLAACTMVRNVSSGRLQEWVAWHRVQGFERFVFFANEPPAATQQAIARYVAEGAVRIVDWSWPKRRYPWFEQVAQQTACILRMRGSARWLALHDVDEFITPLSHRSVRALVDDIDRNTSTLRSPPAALRVHCRYFGTISNARPPDDDDEQQQQPLAIERYSFAAPQAVRDRGKCLVRPTRVNYFLVHMVTSGSGATLDLDPTKQAFFAHFKHPENCSLCSPSPVPERLLLTRFSRQVRDELSRINA